MNEGMDPFGGGAGLRRKGDIWGVKLLYHIKHSKKQSTL